MRLTKIKITQALSDAYFNLKKEKSFTTQTGTRQVENQDPINKIAYGVWKELEAIVIGLENGSFTERLDAKAFSSNAMAEFCIKRSSDIVTHRLKDLKMIGQTIDMTISKMVKIKSMDDLYHLGNCLFLHGLHDYLRTGKEQYLNFDEMIEIQNKKMSRLNPEHSI